MCALPGGTYFRHGWVVGPLKNVENSVNIAFCEETPVDHDGDGAQAQGVPRAGGVAQLQHHRAVVGG